MGTDAAVSRLSDKLNVQVMSKISGDLQLKQEVEPEIDQPVATLESVLELDVGIYITDRFESESVDASPREEVSIQLMI